MNIEAKKVELIEWITKIQDKSLLEQVESLKKQSLIASYESKLKPMTSQQYHSLLDHAQDDYKKGRITTQEDFEKESERW